MKYFDLSFIIEIDLYIKQPEFYLKGKPKKATWIRTILTINLYYYIYSLFLL